MPVAKPRRSKRRAGSSQRANSRQRITQTAKQAQALALRVAGASYDQIAQALGYSNRSGAWHAIEQALLKTIQEPADQIRQLEVARLDRWLFNIDAQIRAGSLEAVSVGLKISARRATLLGLDAPSKHAPTTPDGEHPYAGEGLAALLVLAQQGAHADNGSSQSE